MRCSVRAATLRDLPTTFDLWRVASGHPPAIEPTVLPLHSFLLEHGVLLLAEADGEPVGFVGMHGSEVVLVSDLFVVRPGEGIGRLLLEAAYDFRRGLVQYTSASFDPRAAPLYRSFGMAPGGRLHYFEAVDPIIPPAPTDASVTVGVISSADVAFINECFGWDRAEELNYWASVGALIIRVGDEGAALVCTHTEWNPDGTATRLGPVVARGAARSRDVVHHALRAAIGLTDRSPTVQVMLAEVHPAASWLSSIGFEVVDADLFMASDADRYDLRRCSGAADMW